jgi:hypothetical protein
VDEYTCVENTNIDIRIFSYIKGVHLDFYVGTLSFSKNGKSLGVAFDHIYGELFPAVAFYNRGQELEILSNRCAYIYIHACICLYMCMYIHVNRYICIDIFIIQVHINMYTYTYMYKYVYKYICINVYIDIYV